MILMIANKARKPKLNPYIHDTYKTFTYMIPAHDLFTLYLEDGKHILI